LIRDVDRFVPLGGADSGVPRVDRREVLALLVQRAPMAPADDGIAGVLQRSFSVALLDALKRAAKPPAPKPDVVPAGAPPLPPLLGAFASAGHRGTHAVADDPGVAARAPERAAAPSAPPADEASHIHAAAARAGVDERFLHALRRTENGGPGREFGVLSVPAPTYDDQARVAAESVRRSIERFTARTGRSATDPVTGRYTEEFVRFFSSRWAPVGAANDPTGLNRHHAQNLVRLYAKVAAKDA
jgi:hypothetical protein